MDGIGGSLFRPTPVSSAQQNLSGFYNRTSDFVKEQFASIRDGIVEDTGRAPNPISEAADDERPVAIRPAGLGEVLDILV